MRWLVCGSRDFADEAKMKDVLDHLRSTRGCDVLIHGAARGADLLAAKWAHDSKLIKVIPFRANWKRFGNAAGPLRNQRMLDEGNPDLVIAFPLPESVGTYDMIDRATQTGVEAIVFK